MLIREKNRGNAEIRAAQVIAESINKVIAKKGNAIIAFAGGRNLGGICDILKDLDIDWNRTHIFMVDERLVSASDQESNYNVLYDSLIKYLLDSKELTNENLHPFIFTGNIAKDLMIHENKLKFFGGIYDIVILSSGEDGHIASLFPNHETIRSQEPFFISTSTSPKMPSDRMSSSKNLIMKTKCGLLLFFGEEKRTAFEKFNDDTLNFESCPAKIVRDLENSYIITDL